MANDVINKEEHLRLMSEVNKEDYLELISKQKFLRLQGKRLDLMGPRVVTSSSPPTSYRRETTTVWSFPERGAWATHTGDYRGNWSPYIPRNLLLRYTTRAQWVLDPMMGSGTTLVESRLLGRNAIGVDINPNAVMIARDRLAFEIDGEDLTGCDIHTFVGDARNLDRVHDQTIDLVATHPPYWNIIRYGCEGVEGDFSDDSSLSRFLADISELARECYRVLKKNARCAILIGDTRMRRHVVLISHGVLREFVRAGFLLEEDIVKVQHNTSSELREWSIPPSDFFRIAHEHLYVFRKPRDRSELCDFSCNRLVVDPELESV